jgi:hypothetical protein
MQSVAHCNQPCKHLNTKTDFYLTNLWIEVQENTCVTTAGISIPRGDEAHLLNGSTLR